MTGCRFFCGRIRSGRGCLIMNRQSVFCTERRRKIWNARRIMSSSVCSDLKQGGKRANVLLRKSTEHDRYFENLTFCHHACTIESDSKWNCYRKLHKIDDKGSL